MPSWKSALRKTSLRIDSTLQKGASRNWPQYLVLRFLVGQPILAASQLPSRLGRAGKRVLRQDYLPHIARRTLLLKRPDAFLEIRAAKNLVAHWPGQIAS